MPAATSAALIVGESRKIIGRSIQPLPPNNWVHCYKVMGPGNLFHRQSLYKRCDKCSRPIYEAHMFCTRPVKIHVLIVEQIGVVPKKQDIKTESVI